MDGSSGEDCNPGTDPGSDSKECMDPSTVSDVHPDKQLKFGVKGDVKSQEETLNK